VPPSTILVVNAGSSSLKLSVLGPHDEPLAGRTLGAAESWEEGLASFLDDVPAADAVGHRVVHGGLEFGEAVRMDASVEHDLAELEDLAPLHNPPAVRMIRTLRGLRPDLPAAACFDTTFHRTLPPVASTYALPKAWAERWPLRRFGFHGLSHAYASRRAAELAGAPVASLRVISAHLGAGASLAAVDGGRSVDTTMGFTPLEGLVMATRSGSLDPGLLLWVQRHGGIGAEEAEHALEHEAGLTGLAGHAGSIRDLLEAADAGDGAAQLAIGIYLHRLRAAIAAMAAAMGGLDVLVFTGGVGEGAAEIRAGAADGIAFLGVELDPSANGSTSAADREIGAEGASVRSFVVAAREDRQIASEVRRLFSA
jgi:acetate kinase